MGSTLVILSANQQLIIENRPLSPLQRDACCVKIINVGVCSSDISRAFSNGAYFYPLVMGHEMAGEIVALGQDVTQYKIGDKVAVFPLLPCFKCVACQQESYQQCQDYGYYGSRQDGAYTEYLNVKAWNLLPIPNHISLADAALIEPLAVVLHAIKRAKLLVEEKPMSIAILGAGFLGLLMACILSKKAPHLRVSLFDRNEFKLQIGKHYAHETWLVKTTSEWQKILERKKKTYHSPYARVR